MPFPAAALLASNPSPSGNDIDVAMAGNNCRCGSYVRIRQFSRASSTLLWTQDVNLQDF